MSEQQVHDDGPSQAASAALNAAHQGAGYAPIRYAAVSPAGIVRSTAMSGDPVAVYLPKPRLSRARSEGTEATRLTQAAHLRDRGLR